MRAGRALGVLLDNTWRTSLDFGKQTNGVYSSARRRAARLLHPLRPGAEAGAGKLGVADWASAVAADVVAGLSAVALQLRPEAEVRKIAASCARANSRRT